jgi:tRNA threonylcarbamoyladenosine biosynthesis protein TsaB
MKLLAIDTATEACSAALWWNGKMHERFVECPRGHGALLLGMMDDLLNEVNAKLTDLDALAFGRGPGAFTGVRMAAAVAQAVGFGADLPLVPVSNLALLAQGLYRKHGVSRIIAALDARMQEIYIGAYEVRDGIAQAVNEEQLARPDALEFNCDGGMWHGVGRGWATYSALLKEHLRGQVLSITAEHLCQAQDLLPLALSCIKNGNTVLPDTALPVYLRNQVASKQPGAL